MDNDLTIQQVTLGNGVWSVGDQSPNVSGSDH